MSGNYPDFSISVNILSKLFQHEPHLSHPCDPGARRRVWLHDPHDARSSREHFGLGLCIAREIVLLPAAWLPPIRLKEVEGRLHGRATYSVELRLLHPGAKLSSERRNEVWSQTELQLFDLFTQLSTDPKVIAVENLTVQPGSGAYTPHGEISQTAKADVITCF